MRTILTWAMTLIMTVGSFFGVEPETTNTVRTEDVVVDVTYADIIEEGLEELGWTDVIVQQEGDTYEVWASFDIWGEHYWVTAVVEVIDGEAMLVSEKLERFDEDENCYVVIEYDPETGGYFVYTREL